MDCEYSSASCTIHYDQNIICQVQLNRFQQKC